MVNHQEVLLHVRLSGLLHQWTVCEHDFCDSRDSDTACCHRGFAMAASLTL